MSTWDEFENLNALAHTDEMREMTRLPKPSVIILNYNSPRRSPMCLSSVARTDYAKLNVYLAINRGIDNSVEYVRNNFPWVRVASKMDSLGFAERCFVRGSFSCVS